jgi:hypothetical protein
VFGFGGGFLKKVYAESLVVRAARLRHLAGNPG